MTERTHIDGYDALIEAIHPLLRLARPTTDRQAWAHWAQRTWHTRLLRIDLRSLGDLLSSGVRVVSTGLTR